MRRSVLVRRSEVGALAGRGITSDTVSEECSCLKTELLTRLLLRTWLKEEDVRRTGVGPRAICLLVTGVCPDGLSRLLMRRGDHPEAPLAKLVDLVASKRGVDRELETGRRDVDPNMVVLLFMGAVVMCGTVAIVVHVSSSDECTMAN